jgi:hypothetical protein
MTEISVVFPQPEGPTNMSNSPLRTSKSTPRKAFTAAFPVPKVLVNPLQCTATVASGLAGAIGALIT